MICLKILMFSIKKGVAGKLNDIESMYLYLKESILIIPNRIEITKNYS